MKTLIGRWTMDDRRLSNVRFSIFDFRHRTLRQATWPVVAPAIVHRLSSIVALGTLLVSALAAALPASADTFNYSTGRRQVRVGIVVSHALDVFDPGNANKNLGSENPDPHVFYVLNSRN